MTYFKRRLILDLPVGQSAFLWGARKTGKSSFLKQHFPESIYYDFLLTEEVHKFSAKPSVFRQELEAMPAEKLKYPVIVDEIQKVPELLNEVHWLIENKKVGFILCGSSARKLRRGAANLLGGRAWRFNFYPLIYQEIPDFDLLKALNNGLIPSHYLSSQPHRNLRAYVSDYIAEEVQAEGLVRNLPAFARFIDIVGFTNGEMLNYANIARDCGVNAKTVKEYYQILEDTLVGYLIYPYVKKVKRDIIQSTPRFYLFEVGVANYLAQRNIVGLKGSEAGKAFEHYILMEIKAYLGLNELDLPINYWRSKSGLEVDFVLNQGQTAIEVKISEDPHLGDLKGLRAFCEEHRPAHALVVCQVDRPRKVEIANQQSILMLPWRQFLDMLWSKAFF